MGVSRWRRLARLSWPERGLLLKAAIALPLIDALLRVWGFAATRALLSRVPAGRPRQMDAAGRLGYAQTVARLVRAASNNGLYRPSCLRQSLVLWSILRRQGIEAALHAGVRRGPERVEAHAWVACEGVILTEDSDAHGSFTPFDRALA
jgi:hypothetical protein